ncbi:hypothetical protein WDU94_002395, partial [Cyamophila willieti]
MELINQQEVDSMFDKELILKQKAILDQSDQTLNQSDPMEGEEEETKSDYCSDNKSSDWVDKEDSSDEDEEWNAKPKKRKYVRQTAGRGRGRRKTKPVKKGAISDLSDTEGGRTECDDNNSEPDKSETNLESETETGRTRKKYTRKKHPCKYCTRLFRRPGEVKNHILVSHLGKNPNQCAFCSKTFNSRNGLYVHLKRLHNVEYSDRMEILDNNDTKDLDKDLLAKQKEILQLGDQMSLDENDSDWAQQVKDGIKRSRAVSKSANEKLTVSVKCLNEDGTIGDEVFVKEETVEVKSSGEGGRKRTRRPRTGERFTMPLIHACDQCGKKWRTVSELNAHIQTHSDLRPFVCEICGQ